jgi:RNA polymerase sigma-70 factor (family 1)
MSLQDSEDLLVRFNQEEPGARTWVYNEYYPFVYSVVKRLTSGSPDIKDLVTDSFIKLLSYKGKFESLIKIKFFLFTATRNVCIDYLKHKKIVRTKAFDIGNYWRSFQHEPIEKVEKSAAFRSMIYEAIETLPRQRRQIFLLFYFKGLKNSEIAKRFGISEKTVSNQKTIALKILRMKLVKMSNILKSFIIVFFFMFSRYIIL